MDVVSPSALDNAHSSSDIDTPEPPKKKRKPQKKKPGVENNKPSISAASATLDEIRHLLQVHKPTPAHELPAILRLSTSERETLLRNKMHLVQDSQIPAIESADDLSAYTGHNYPFHVASLTILQRDSGGRMPDRSAQSPV
ncbi:hypothetical protein CERZMDRAFT_82795 [Cercospora zeae-maydis SCOH1-5]|uniref:Uncharacterized protein n=1 Tax=Cercospora zeae-maydis SCOH1-5 TaxID=717836 RepID=A0A6A6FNF9_9PEZI|nr:hypothetical protein CERZMDRAFT_82795 [Cercospora zeae-maydis SCOH1-5]